ncbi:MAG: putative rane protein [Clostridiales bacterium]|jgi:c-di-AMP phosphodiesterase-like protein|nr:putative rane protein [Clostridiales bacterium]
MSKKLKLSGALKAYLFWPIIMTGILLCMNLSIYVIDRKSGFVMSGFVLVYFITSITVYYLKRNKIATELVRYAMDYGQVQKRLLKELALPYAILDVDGKMQWGNDEFMDIIHEKKAAKHSITNIFPDITVDTLPKKEKDEIVHINLNGRNYRVLLRKVLAPNFDEDVNWNFYETENAWDSRNALIAMYLYDETEIITLLKENKEQKLITGLLYIDNYEEALESIDEVRRSLLTALVDRKINKYMQGIDAIIKKLEKDKYIIIFQQKYLPSLQSSKFSILEEVRSVNIGNEMSVTISIGLGVNADTYINGYEFARAAIDLALGRGGDQVVIKDREKISYYGGKSIQVEKSTRVKARVKAHAFREFVEAKDKIVIMGHKIGDIDSFGSAIGIYRIAKTFNKKVHIVINEVTTSLRPMMNRFVGSTDYEEDLFLKNEQVKEVVDVNTLLVVVDVNRPSYTECAELLDYTKTVVIFDHHRQTNEAIENAVLSYIEPYASSTSEMVAEILQYIGGNLKLKPTEADALYAGIMIDTNNFLTKAGVRTFEAAAFLRRSGADVTRIRKLFRSEMTDYKIKADAISSTEIYLKHYAIAVCASSEVDSPMILGAQVANELLDIKDIKASFVLTEFNSKIYISARSIDEVNVQVVMEKLGGGGHLSVAGSQLENSTPQDAITRIKSTLATMIEEGEL